jgi:MFS family permease
MPDKTLGLVTTPSIHSDRSAHTYASKALIVSAAGYAMDGFDLLILSFLLRPMARELHLTPTESGSLVTGTLAGAVFGGLIFGVLSDHYGRVRLLSWTILLFAVFTGMCALAQGYWDLFAYRTAAGLGLGGEFGIGMTLVAEAWPANMRARVSSYVGLGWQCGVLLAALVTLALLPVIGWRGVWAVGVFPAIVVCMLRRTLAEPEIFNATKSAHQRFRLRFLVKDTAITKASMGMLILCSVQNFGYYGIMIWLPSYLSNRFNYSLTQSGLWTAVTVLGMGFGIWLFGQLADRYGRRPIFVLYQAGAAVSVIVYSQLTAAAALLAGGAIMGVFVNGMVGGYGALMSELYPTEVRATAQNVLFNLGRAVGGFGPLVVGAISVRYSFAATTGLLALIYFIDLLATALLIPETKGMELQ